MLAASAASEATSLRPVSLAYLSTSGRDSVVMSAAWVRLPQERIIPQGTDRIDEACDEIRIILSDDADGIARLDR